MAIWVILVPTVLVTGSASAATGAVSDSVGKQEVPVADDVVLFDNRELDGGLGAVEKLPFIDMSRPDDPAAQRYAAKHWISAEAAPSERR